MVVLFIGKALAVRDVREGLVIVDAGLRGKTLVSLRVFLLAAQPEFWDGVQRGGRNVGTARLELTAGGYHQLRRLAKCHGFNLGSGPT